MGFLDAYDTFVGNRCKELTKQNSTVSKLTESLGLSNLVGGVEDYLSRGVVESLKDSPLRDLAEDVLSQTITDTARRLSQNLMNQIPDKLTNTLTDIRSTAFNAVFTTLTFQNDMVLYFASVVAQECVDAIRDKRRTLISLQESVRKLHNALLTLAGGGPFFNEYIQNLRLAIIRLDDADTQLAITQSLFFSQTRFSQANFNRAKELLRQAHELITPPVTGEDAEELNQGFLKGVFQNPSAGRQLGMLQSIPKLAKEMLGNYDLYAVKVIKVNALLLGFQSTVQNLQEVTGGQFKDTILSHLEDTRAFLRNIIDSMATEVNGAKDAIRGPVNNQYNPNPTLTSARAIEWGVRVKAAEVMLETIDADALQTLSISNDALREYNTALDQLSELDDRVGPLAILRATDGREQPGDIEGSIITFAFQANQAIVDSALLPGQNRRFDDRNVLALGQQVNQRLELSIQQDREIELILLRYIKASERTLQSIRDLGNSVFSLLDNLGMDRASDFLKRGAFGEFFSMNGRTATYVGAAVAGLSALQAALTTDQQRQCVVGTINQLKVAETSKRLATQRTVTTNFVKQQEQNSEECQELQQQKAKTEGCTVGLDVADLRDNPLQSLQGIFRGIFGGDIADALSGTGLGTLGAELLDGGPGLGGIINFDGAGSEGVTGIFSNSDFASLAASDSLKAASDSVNKATDALKNALGDTASEGDTFSDLTKKAQTKLSKGDDSPGLLDAILESDIAKDVSKEADKLFKNNKKVKSAFGKFL